MFNRFFVLLLYCFCPILVVAQTTASLRGTVTAPDGAVLPGAVVRALSPALIAGQVSTVTGANGSYRFPNLAPGLYRLEASLDGFNTAVSENLSLRLGQELELALVLTPSLAESVMVTVTAPLTSAGNEVSQNFQVEQLERLPVSHEVNNIINYAPGINENRAYGATGEGANGFKLDGVDVSDPATGEHWMLPHMDWVQDIQITGLGANAEYGGYTGALFNVITRSGGNEFSGTASLYYSGDSLVSDNTPDEAGDLTPSSLDRDLDLAVSVGGPIVKNKVWYFLSAQRAEKEETPLGAERAEETTLNRYLFKVTAQPKDGSLLTGLFDFDGKKQDYRGVGRDTLADAATFQDSPNYSYNLTWDWTISSMSLLTLKASGFNGKDDRLSAKGRDVAGRTDLESGLNSGNNAYSRYQDKRRQNLSADYSLFLDSLFGSETHAVKMGLSLENARHQEDRFRNGGLTYVDDTYGLDVLTNPEDRDEYLSDPGSFAFSSDQGNEIHLDSVQNSQVAYLQDAISWEVFQLSAGIRFTSFEAGFKDRNESVYDVETFDPRLGFSWNLGKNRDTALKLHYGRYHESLFAYLYDREVSGAAFEDTVYVDYNPETGAYDLPGGGRAATLAELDGSIEHPYVDQFLITLEHSYSSHQVVAFDLIHRENKNIIAMVNTRDHYDVLNAPGNPYGGNLPFYDLLSRPVYLLTNPDDAYRDYDSAVLRYERRHSDGWSLRSSLVWSDLTGNAFAGDGYVDEWVDRNGTTNGDGRLPGFSDWEFKLSGSVDLPYAFELGAYMRYLSGEYWTPTAQIRGLYRNDRQEVFLTERGSQQLPSRTTVDLKLSRQFQFGNGLKLDTYLDIFNVFNKNTTLAVDQRWGTYFYDYDNHPDGSEFVSRSAFQSIQRIESPREIRFGSRLKF